MFRVFYFISYNLPTLYVRLVLFLLHISSKTLCNGNIYKYLLILGAYLAYDLIIIPVLRKLRHKKVSEPFVKLDN